MANWDLYAKKFNLLDETQQDRQISAMKKSIDDSFNDSLSCKEVYLNSATKATKVQVTDMVNQDEKNILMMPNDVLNVGDYIKFDNQNWICISANKTNPVYESGIINKCTHTLLVVKNGTSKEVPCVISNTRTVETTEGTKFFPLAEGKIAVTVSNNDDGKAITYNQVYQIGLNKYKVSHVDDIKDGLIIFTMDLTQENIKETPPLPSIFMIVGSDTIRKNESCAYHSDIPCIWSLSNEDGSDDSYVSIVSQTSTEIVLKAGTALGEIVNLVAKSVSDEDITNSKAITIVGLF